MSTAVVVVAETRQVIEVQDSRDAISLHGNSILNETPANEDVLVWITANSQYEHKQIDEIAGGFVNISGDTMTGALIIDGTADTNQLRVQGHSTQTADLFVVEDSGGTDILAVSLTAITASQNVIPVSDGAQDLGLTGTRWQQGYFDDLTVTTSVATDYIQFNASLTPPAYAEGQAYWDTDDKTLLLRTETSDVSLQVGQEMHVRATNKSGAQIDNGKVVYVDGAQGNRPTIALAEADVQAKAEAVIGIATHDIADNATGYVTTFGLVRGLNTLGFTEGGMVYLSDTAGAFTETPPGATSTLVKVGVVLRAHATEGIIFFDTRLDSFNGVVGGVAPDAGTFTTLNATGGGALTGTWTDLGSVTTIDINGGTVGGVTLDGTISGTPTWASTQAMDISGTAATVTVIDSTDATSFIAMFDSATGSLAVKTDGGLTYDATTGILSATGLSGPLNGTVGATSPSTGVFTTLNATGGGALTGTWSDLGTVTTVDIDGGTLDGVTIGGASAAAGTFTAISGTSLDIAGATPTFSLTDNNSASTLARGSFLLRDNAAATRWEIGSLTGGDLEFNTTSGQLAMTMSGTATTAEGTLTSVGNFAVTTGVISMGASLQLTEGIANRLDLGTNGSLRLAGTGSIDVSGTGTLKVASGVSGLAGRVLAGYENTVDTGEITNAGLQFLGASEAASTMSIGNWEAAATAGSIRFFKSRDSQIAQSTVVVTGDQLGEIRAYGDDGVDFATQSSAIIFDTEGTIAAGQIPGIIRFQVAATGTLADALVIDSAKAAVFSGALTASNGGSLTGTWTDLGAVTTVDINGGTVDGTIIGGAVVAAGSFAAIVGTTATLSGVLSVDDTTDSTSASTGSIHTDGGLGVTKSVFISGTMGMGATPSAGQSIRLQSTLTGDTTQQGLNLNPRFDSQATNRGIGVDIKVQTTAQSFTQANMYGIRVQSVLIGPGSAVTDLYGLNIANQTGASDNWAIKTGTGTVDFGDEVIIAGILSVDDTTTSTSITTGSGVFDGGVGIAENLFVGGNVDLSGGGTLTATGGGSLTGTWTDLGTVTTVDINGGTIDGTIIGGAVVAAGSFAAIIGTTGVYSGILKTDDVTQATTTTDGSLQTDGGLSVVLDTVLGGSLAWGGGQTISSSDIVAADYAGIRAEGNAAASVITLADSWFKVTVFDSDMVESGSNGDNTSNDITVGLTSDYGIDFNVSGSSASANKVVGFHVYNIAAATATITAATAANPVVITASGHGLSNGDEVKITGAGGMVEINDRIFKVAGVSGTSFNLQDDNAANIDGTGFTAFTSGGTTQAATEDGIHSVRKTGAGGDIGSQTAHSLVGMILGDTVELYIMNETDATNFTAREIDFSITHLA